MTSRLKTCFFLWGASGQYWSVPVRGHIKTRLKIAKLRYFILLVSRVSILFPTSLEYMHHDIAP